MTNSPLQQASPLSLNELFNKDPETLSPQEEDAIIEALRADRKRFVTEDAAKPVRTAAAAKSDAKGIATLADLGL